MIIFYDISKLSNLGALFFIIYMLSCIFILICLGAYLDQKPKKKKKRNKKDGK